MKKINLAYIAGFFDGEGSLCLRFRGRGRKPDAYIEITNTHLGTLKHILYILKIGRIVKRRKLDHRGIKDQWRYRLFGNHRVSSILKLLYPFLIQKKSKAKRVLKLIK